MKHPMDGLLIRSAVVLNSDTGFILAFDPGREEVGEEHAVLFRWHAGNLSRGDVNFSAHASCIITRPVFGLLRIGVSGSYSIETAKGSNANNIFRVSSSGARKPRYGDIRTVVAVEGRAYAAGHGGSVFVLDETELWTPIGQELPENFDIEAIHGFGSGDIYAAGFKGTLWRYGKRGWRKIQLPTDVTLNCILCASDDRVYIGGYAGTLLSGRDDTWDLLALGQLTDDVWSLVEFGGNIYCSTMSGVYQLNGDVVSEIDFGSAKPNTTYQLSAVDEVMWSVGRGDIVAYDGNKWTTLI
jgi:hypothetical protein